MAMPGVGDDIEDVCARCGDSWHVVMAKMGDRIAKVVCKRCGSQHNYRSADSNAPAPASGGTGAGPRRTLRRRASRSTEPVAPPAPPFDPSKPPRPYSARDTFVIGERIQHPSFGTGVVSTIPGPGKVEVVFPAGARTLACAKVSAHLERPVAAEHVPIADRPPDAPPSTVVPTTAPPRRQDS